MQGDNDVICYYSVGQCCRLHVVGQQIVSDAEFVVVEEFVAYVLNLTMLICATPAH